MGNKVVHFEVVGKDAEKLHKFYAEAFDWKVNVMPEFNYGLVDPADAGIGGGIGAPGPGGEAGVMFYVGVPDLQAHLDKIVALGGQVKLAPTEVPGANVHLATFTDPAGQTIGLVKV